MSAISFSITAREGRARAGTLQTPHGVIETPAFVPVGTKADVKGILPDALEKLGAQVVLANTYHLYLQPSEGVVKKAGGLGKFMHWNGPTMTDSGGFQVFSLGAAFGKTLSKFTADQASYDAGVAVYDDTLASQHGQLAVVDDEGVTFTSHHDGTLHRFTPERSVEIQHALGADMFFAFDEFKSPLAPFADQKESMERTHRWAERSLKAHRQNLDSARRQAIFGIVQGGRHEDLRRESARAIAKMGFDGFGIGGTFSKADLASALMAAVEELPDEAPRHLLGIGEPGDVLTGIAEGMDLFDCVAATRIGRHGSIYTKRGIVHLSNGQFKEDFQPLDPETIISGTEGFSRAYVSHLVRSKEILGSVICSMHNLGFILKLVDGAREAIRDGKFAEYRREFVDAYYANRTNGEDVVG